MNPTLFSPLQLRDITLRNRVVASPMLTYCAKGGHVNDRHLIHLGKLAAGGTGLVFMEATKVDPAGCSTVRDAGLWKDDFIPALQRITAAIRGYGAVPGIQLSHSGRKARRTLPWEGRQPMHACPGVDHGERWDLIAPSALAHAPGYPVPHEMSLADIATQVGMWAQATRRADAAGFDVIEIHGAHGYLLHEFLSAESNQRNDGYGGSFESRMRFALEVVSAVRAAWPDHKPLFFRISAVDECDWRIEDSIALAHELKRHGVDVIDCSSGGMGSQPTVDGVLSYGYQAQHAQRIRAGADIATMAVGLIVHADQAEQILRSGQADLVALGRELLLNPNWPIDAAQKLGLATPFAHIDPTYGYWLEKRARNRSITPSTFSRGLQALSATSEASASGNG